MSDRPIRRFKAGPIPMRERYPDCFVCDDEGWCLWDDDQGRYRAATFGWLTRKGDPEPCQECNRRGEYTYEEWTQEFKPEGR